MAKDKYEMKKSIKIVPVIKEHFKSQEVFRAKDLGLLIGDDLHTIKMKLKRVKLKWVLGVIIFKVGNCNSELWFYREIKPLVLD